MDGRGNMMPIEQMVTVPCDCCGRDDQRLLFIKEGFRHVRCRVCGLVFVNPILADHLRFQKESGTGGLGEVRLTLKEKSWYDREIRKIEPYRACNRVLDVGAGRGWFLAAASEAGWQTWAVEVNQTALVRLAEKKVDRVINESAEDFQVPAGSVDVVRMWDVVEHLRSPRKAINNVYRALRPGGGLLLSTTNFASLSRLVNGPEWVYLNGADHIVLFEPASISRLLGMAGFKGIKVRTRSFKPQRKLYHPEKDLPPPYPLMGLFRNIIHELVRFTKLGHQMIVTAVKSVR